MKLVTTSICLMLLACGCCYTKFRVKKADGTEVSIENVRAIWTTDSYSATLSTNGAALSANKSSTDKEAIAAIVQGAVQGAAAAAKP